MRAQVKIIQQQQETVNNDQRQLSEEETKAFLYKNYPDLYKKLYPNEVIEKPKQNPTPLPHQKREGQDIQKSDKVYTYNKYGTGEGGFNYNIQIKTDMDLNQ